MRSSITLGLCSLFLSQLAMAASEPVSQQLGLSFQGEITLESPLHLNDGTAYQVHLLCSGEQAQSSLYQFQSDMPALLSLFSSDQRLINRLFVEGGEDGPQVLVTPPENECRYMVVTAQEPGWLGSYQFWVQELTPIADSLAINSLYSGSTVSADEHPELILSEQSLVNFLIADSSRSLSASLISESHRYNFERCDSHALTLRTIIEPGTYQLVLSRLISDEVYPLLYDYCGVGLVDSGPLYVLATTTSPMPEGMRNEGRVGMNDQVIGMLQSTENSYSLTVDEASRFDIRLESDDFDTVLAITGPNTDLENDDWGEGTNSALFPVLMPGDYQVFVTSWSGDGTGLYQLSLSAEAFDGELISGGEILPGQSLQGMLLGDENYHSFRLEERARIVLSMDSDDFDAYLELYGEGIELSDDDGGEGLNARISALLEAGEYDVVATSYSGSGSYLLTLITEAFDAQISNEGTLRPGDSVTGMLSGSSELIYTLEIENAAQYRIDVRSNDVDAYLTLNGEGVYLEDDDSGDGTNACLALHLEPGTYQLTSSALFGVSHGLLETSVTVVRGRGARGC